ncbi:MAG: NYN domain-containing protein [Armatimonadota bacterium]|nr:NYN domain-containing protein [Armatimonadota bacterium]
MRTCAYIDGFNLYYGATKGTPYRWLDVGKFCKFMLPGHSVLNIKYYTARVSAQPHDPNQPVRQQTYLRALSTIPNLSIVYGHFLTHEVTALLATCQPGGPATARVLRTEEKGSDVNLATHLLWDGIKDVYDVAAVVSNDSDLLEPIRIAKLELGKRIIVINPHKDKPSRQLRQIADEFKTIKPATLAACQFPATLTDAHGSFSKPPTW